MESLALPLLAHLAQRFSVPAAKPFGWAEFIDHAIALAILIGLSFAILLLTRMVVMPVLRRVIKKTRFEWDDVFLDASTFKWLGRIPPAVVFTVAAEILDSDYIPLKIELREEVVGFMQGVSTAFIVLCIMMAINASLTALNIIYRKRSISRSRPIKGFVQLAKIFVAIIGSICAIALLFGQEPWEFLKYSAGMTAVLLFVFKDTILSLVASIQLTSNDMLQVGDWIEVPGCGADGDIVDVALHTVKVQNFDKTIVTVPTYKLVTGAFRNWRGMSESGGRRIKREMRIDVATVRFLNDSDLDRLGKIELLSDYLAEKRESIAADGAKNGAALNQRRLTNLGTFRAYVVAYIRSLPKIHDRFTFLVRQLEATATGVPLQIYVFTNTTNWIEYEHIQADIFDHLLAAIRDFDLRVFQEPTGRDLEGLRQAAV